MSDLAVIGPTEIDSAADPGKFVELACERAKEWLAQALEHGDIDGIVELKSQAEAIRTYTVQKQLGKDAELSAAEIVRRAERGIAIAVRRGQDDGTIKTSSDGGVPSHGLLGGNSTKLSTRDVWPPGHENERADSYRFADAPDATFESALTEAKAEANLSRANVVRKVARKVIVTAEDADENRIVKARRMATEGYTSRQIGKAIGVKDMGGFRNRHGIEVPADAVVGKTHRHDSNRILAESVAALEGLVMSVDLLDLDDLDRERLNEWATSLSDSLRCLNRLSKQLKEMTQ